MERQSRQVSKTVANSGKPVRLKRGPRWHARFLRALRDWPNVAQACRAAGISRMTAYRARRSDPDFAQRWAEAIEEGYGRLEDRAVELAAVGWKEPIYYQGEQVGTVNRKALGLMKFLLERRVEGYGEHKHVEHWHRGRIQVRLPDNHRGPVQVYPTECPPAHLLPPPVDVADPLPDQGHPVPVPVPVERHDGQGQAD